MSEQNEQVPLTEGVYYILLSLYTPMHGYGVMQYIQRISNDRINMGPGTLYGAIKTMLEKNWIESIISDQDSRKKEYMITDLGKTVVLAEINRLQELLKNGNQIVGSEKNDH